MTQETKTRYEVIKEAFEARKDVETDRIFDALLEEGVKNGSYETIAIVETLDEARQIMADNPTTVKKESAFATWVQSAYIIYAEEQEWNEDDGEWIPTGCYESAPIVD